MKILDDLISNMNFETAVQDIRLGVFHMAVLTRHGSFLMWLEVVLLISAVRALVIPRLLHKLVYPSYLPPVR